MTSKTIPVPHVKKLRRRFCTARTRFENTVIEFRLVETREEAFTKKTREVTVARVDEDRKPTAFEWTVGAEVALKEIADEAERVRYERDMAEFFPELAR